MGKIIIFGAGGKAGKHTVREAVRGGHDVTAVVRDPSKHESLVGDRVTVVRGDVTDASDVARLAAGHDAAVSTAARLDIDATAFYTAATDALVTGLATAGVSRAVLIGIGTTLTVDGTTMVHDTDGFPEEGRAFSLGHAAELEILERDGARLDWLVLAPPPVMLDDEAERTGVYRTGGRQLIADAAPTFSYADLAVAVVSEATEPLHHRDLVAVAH
jgi:putative NADH-flavin reductase